MYTWRRYAKCKPDDDSYTGNCEKLTRRVEGVGQKLFMDSLFSSADLFDDLHTRGIN
jgi:hypothetical protein